MRVYSVTTPPRWMENECPFCHGKLGWLEKFRRKTGRICRCRKCGRIIKGRFIVR